MTVKELRYLVDNLDEYIRVPGGIERLKRTILHLAVSGKLVPQDPREGTGEELYKQIQAEKQKLIAEGKIKKQKSLPPITDGEIPFLIPESWKWVRLGDVGTVGTGATPQRDNQLYYGGTIPWVTSALTSQDIILTTDEHITKKAISETNCSIYPTGSLVIAMYGQGKTRGQVATLGIDAATNQACAVFVKTPESGLRREYIRKVIEACYETMRRVAAGGAQPNLNIQKVKELIVPLPPAGEQMRIIDKINVIFALIDQLSEKYLAEQAERQRLVLSSLAQLSQGNGDLALQSLGEIIHTKAGAAQLRKTILHLAVSGKLVPQNPSEGTGEELYQQIRGHLANRKQEQPLTTNEEKIPFTIPSNWRWVELAKISKSLSAGGDKPKDFTKEQTSQNSIPVIANGETNTGIIGFTKMARVTEVSVTVSGRGTIGYSVVRDYPYTPIVRLLVITPADGVLPQYIQFVFSSLFEGGLGTSIPQLTVPMIRSKPIPLPPRAEQERIVQKTTQLLNLVTQLELHLVSNK